MNFKNSKQLIINNLKKEKSCLEDLIVKIGEQKKAIEDKDGERVLEIIKEKNVLIEVFQNIEEEVAAQIKILSKADIQSLEKEEKSLKQSLEKLLETIVSMEDECEKDIGLKMQEIEKRIIGLQEGKKIGKGYGMALKSRPLISRKA
ncbi:hypothetical protein HON22_04565 [Candidatus Peregrinibacteria bacterium]|nr:hypothetical protein [Candidatus Peregrinibacteria bacterium]